jgi:protein SCO1/2
MTADDHVQIVARSASDQSRGAALDPSHGRKPVVSENERSMSPVGATDSVDSFAPAGLISETTLSTGLRPWLGSNAAPRLNKDAAIAAAFFIITSFFASTASAQNPDSVLTQIGIEQRLGVQVDPTIEFRDESGQTVRLGDYFGAKPLILTPVYYECPMLCSMLLNGLVKALHVMPFTAGKEFEIISFSIDPNEQPDLAAQKKLHYVRDYGKAQAAAGWHFLTGTEQSIHRLAEQIGFRYTYDTYTKQWAHASGIVLLTPAGMVSQYFYGIEFDPADLRLSLIQASNQRLGSLTDHILLYCFQYNPTTGKYSIAIMRVLRAFAVATVLLIAGFIFVESRRKRIA